MAAEPLLSRVVLLYRRIAILRDRGQFTAAEELRAGEFAHALAAMEAEAASAGEVDAASRLQSILATEDERVANASVLARLLAPMLEDLLRPAQESPSAALPGEKTFEADVIEPTPPAAGARPPLSVADFIEGMLLQEKSAQRRAS